MGYLQPYSSWIKRTLLVEADVHHHVEGLELAAPGAGAHVLAVDDDMHVQPCHPGAGRENAQAAAARGRRLAFQF